MMGTWTMVIPDIDDKDALKIPIAKEGLGEN
jgi:hypothetical protein